jgi:osmotically-inducible protein OsmY
MKLDKQILFDLIDALDADMLLREQAIAVGVRDGIVTLKGTVHSHALKVMAEQAVKRIRGVRGFAESLQVHPPMSEHRTDQEIVQAALRALKWNVLVPADRVMIKCEHGWLTLFGEVAWQCERDAAYHAVRLLTAVRGVSNRITVKGFVAPIDVKDRIAQAFERHARQDAQDVVVIVDGSSVTLEGTVQTHAESEDAEHAAWSAPGINEVHNALKIHGSESPHDQERSQLTDTQRAA